MKAYSNIELIKDRPSCVLTIGNFDGLHLGHQQLLTEMSHLATELKLQSYLMTFSPHPASILSPTFVDHKIQSKDEFEFKLKSFDVDHLIIHPFTKELSLSSADEFIDYILRHLDVRVLVIGYDFKFGQGKKGDYHFLSNKGKELGFKVIQVPQFKYQGLGVSSTQIRSFLRNGNISMANTLLGDVFVVSGQVIKGLGRGGTIGFPTANLRPDKGLFLKKGVYKTKVHWQGRTYSAISNFGSAPTIKKEDVAVLETHIFDFSENIYDELIKVEFIEFIRPEFKFSGLDDLLIQIHQDILKAKT